MSQQTNDKQKIKQRKKQNTKDRQKMRILHALFIPSDVSDRDVNDKVLV